jgi:hypothetical protein
MFRPAIPRRTGRIPNVGPYGQTGTGKLPAQLRDYSWPSLVATATACARDSTPNLLKIEDRW